MASWDPLKSQPSFNADTMLLLTDGTVLCHEANSAKWHKLTPDATGSYVNGTWSNLASLPDNNSIPAAAGGPTNAPLYFASAVLADGTVITAGGEYNSGNANADILTVQIYDPIADAWSTISTPAGWTGIGDAVSCVLPDGRFLLGNFSSSQTALFDPVTQIWQAGGAKGDSCSEETFTLMPNGAVLTVQCSNSPNAEQYVPSSNTWFGVGSTGSTLPQACPGFVAEIGPALLLPDGRVLAVGATGATALYTPNADPTKAGTWANGPTLQDSGGNTLFPMDAPGVLLPNGKVMLTASPGPPCGYPSPTTFFLYDPATNAATIVTGPANNGGPAYTGRLLLLPTGQVLYSNNSTDIRVYTPDAGGQSSWKPAITVCPTTLITGHTYKISGTQFNGLSQACSYGDDAQMATNYPIVRLSNTAGQVVYLRTSNHSTMGVATGGTTVSTNIAVPGTLGTGPWSLVVIANGIASDPVAVTVGTEDCFFIVDRSTYAQGEIQALINLNGSPATIDDALFLVVEGFSKAQVGAAVPVVSSPVAKISLQSSGPPIPQDPTLPASAIQRLTFPFRVLFQDTSMFTATAQTLTLNASFSATGSTVFASAQIQLLNTPNPYVLDGDVANGKPWYLSVDLRVFQVKAGETKFAATTATAGSAQSVATAFIAKVISNLNADPSGLGGVFQSLPQDDEDATPLALAPADTAGTAVYNFALARVRYRDVQTATNVRVFFRLWPAQQTNATYDVSTTYRSAVNGVSKIPILGIVGDEITTIPFFASPRVGNNAKLTTQSDAPNVRNISPDQFGAEVDSYFGCWLDINQPGDLRFPPRMVGGNPADIPDGPFASFSPLVSIQQLVRSQHQCLLAEVSFDPDPIPPNADPSTSDKLAQRNLAFVNVPNPGIEASRIAPQTFEVRPTPLVLKADNRPDELMIQWGNTPAATPAAFYLPGANAAEIMTWAGKLYTTHNLTQLDAHTIGVLTGGVTYLPIPRGTNVNFAGLVSLELPATIHKGEKYNVVLRQITTADFQQVVIQIARRQAVQVRGAGGDQGGNQVFTWRRTLGVFQISIPVSTKTELLVAEERFYAIARWIQKAIPTTSRWYPVFQRYVKLLGGRVDGLGGDSSKIQPSGTGDVAGDNHKHDHDEHCLEFTGKIAGRIYDHFGDFEGFLLATGCEGERRFCSRESRIERIVRDAWAERSTVTVVVYARDVECPVKIIIAGVVRCSW
jgi:hypothetical protein